MTVDATTMSSNHDQLRKRSNIVPIIEMKGSVCFLKQRF